VKNFVGDYAPPPLLTFKNEGNVLGGYGESFICAIWFNNENRPCAILLSAVLNTTFMFFL
jgi:hypothetical protein